MNAGQMINEYLSRFGLPEVSSIGGTGTDSAIALRKLNLAQQMISTAAPFKWAEKTSPGQITAVQGTSTYTLASDVAHVIAAKHVYNGGGFIDVVDRETMEQYRPKRSDSSQQAVPTHMTTLGVSQSSVSSTPLIQAEVWPVPNSDFDAEIIYYYYTFVLTDLSALTDIPLIPGDYHWLIVDIAEGLGRTGVIRTGGDNMASQIDLFAISNNRAKEGLRKLIERDSSLGAKTATWSVDLPGI